MKRIASLCLALLLALSLAEPAMAVETTKATKMEVTEYNGTVTIKDAAGKSITTREGKQLYNGYTVETGKSSTVYISLDSAKAVKLGANGKIEIKKNGKQIEIHIDAGELFFNVTEKLKSDESMKLSSSNFVTGVRGTSGAITPKDAKAFTGVLALTIYGGVSDGGNELPPIDLPLVAGNKLDVEKVIEAVQQAIGENKPLEEVQQKMEEAA